MTLGFSVEALVDAGRGGGALKMGLRRLAEADWLQPDFDCDARRLAFEAGPQSLFVHPEAIDAGRLTASAVAFPTDWRLADKMGLPLTAVHAPIHGYAEQLAVGVDHFFQTLSAGPIHGRANWFVVPTDAWRYMPADDPAARSAHVDAANAGETLFVRCERQTVRRLPNTGAMLFTIGIAVAPLGALSGATVRKVAAGTAAQAAGERARRAAPFYAGALTGYAAGRQALESV